MIHSYGPSCNCNSKKMPKQMRQYQVTFKSAKDFVSSTFKSDTLGRTINRYKKPAVVLDIDETIFQTHCWVCGKSFDDVVPIPSAVSFYKNCIKNGVSVFFVTARHEDGFVYTQDQLRRHGFCTYAGLFLKPKKFSNYVNDIQHFKTLARRYISSKKFSILVNMGDQPHDVSGGYSKMAYLLPSFNN